MNDKCHVKEQFAQNWQYHCAFWKLYDTRGGIYSTISKLLFSI